VAGSASWTNYSVQGTVTLTADYGGSLSLLARVQDDNHLYFFGYSSATGTWMIARKDGPGVTTVLATGAPFAMQANQDYIVRADVNGSSLALYVNGVLQVSTNDSTYASGKIGFSATWDQGMLGDVTVTADAGSSTAAASASVGSSSPAHSSSVVAATPVYVPGFLFNNLAVTGSDFGSGHYQTFAAAQGSFWQMFDTSFGFMFP
jgi:hypothetical protein